MTKKITELNKQLAEYLEDDNVIEVKRDINDFYWNMVKDFDEFVSKNNFITEEVINEVLKTNCGLELQLASIALIPNRETYNLLPYSNSFSLDEKIEWLIDYMDKVAKEDLIGLKLSDGGKIKYKFRGKNYKKTFIIHIGNCLASSEKLISNEEQPCGLHHMKYGDSGHWIKSREALKLIPKEFKNPVAIGPSNDPSLKYNYVFYSSSGYTYAFGIPYSSEHHAILITCY